VQEYILAVEISPEPYDYDEGFRDAPVHFIPSVDFPTKRPESSYRSSPIFAVAEDPLVPNNNGDYSIHLLALANPFRAIGRLLVRDPSYSKHVWYSLGQCSLLVVGADLPNADSQEALFGEQPLARELWHVRDGKLVSAQCHCPEPTVFDRGPYSIGDYSGLPVPIRGVVDEFVTTLDTLVGLSARYLPSELAMCAHLATIARGFVEDFAFLRSDMLGSVPRGLRKYEAGLRTNAVRRLQLENQRLDQLVQINSALSYAASQAFHASIPILAWPSLIRRYSLLGIGTAYRAILAITRSVEEAFKQYPVEEVVTRFLPKARPLPGIESEVTYDPAKWNETTGVDTFLADLEPGTEVLSKIPYFSGRSGFRESQFAVSTALQVLFAGDGKEWHLSTVTHEIMHGHVRNLLGRVLASDSAVSLEESFHSIYETYERDLTKDRDSDEISALDSIRAIILTYCLLTDRWGSLTRIPTKENGPSTAGKTIVRGEIKLWSEAETWRSLKREIRNINEVFVLVLDLHYAYRGQLSLYLRAVWQTWSAVPGVLIDVRQYVLRSLLAAASVAESQGDVFKRFEQAKKYLSESLKSLEDAPHSNGLVMEALSYLQRSGLKKDLLPAFTASVMLVDLAKHVFYSTHVAGEMFAGDVLGSEDEAPIPGLAVEPGRFTDVVLATPFSIMNRAVSRMLDKADDSALERHTAWLLLACASSRSPSGDEK